MIGYHPQHHLRPNREEMRPVDPSLPLLQEPHEGLADERRSTTLTPGGVANARWTSKTVLTWDTTAGAAEYHVYRDLRSNLAYGNFGVCRDDLDATRTDTQLTDTSTPTAGQCFVYVIAADDLGGPGGSEGTMGEAKCMERSNYAPCP